jgi:signal recognition particle subunit SRP54
MRQIRRMGPLEDLLDMMPGAGKLKGMKGLRVDDRQLTRVEAIINSMTPEERRKHRMINGSRRLRIARGSGTTVQDINRLLKQFAMMQKMLKQFKRKGGTKQFMHALPFS